jgi:hypothetical protein
VTARVMRGYLSIGIISRAIAWTWPMMTSEMDRVIVVKCIFELATYDRNVDRPSRHC